MSAGAWIAAASLASGLLIQEGMILFKMGSMSSDIKRALRMVEDQGKSLQECQLELARMRGREEVHPSDPPT